MWVCSVWCAVSVYICLWNYGTMELWNKDWTHTNNSDILCVEPPYIYKDPDKDYCFTFYERDPDGIHS
jgi:hypothetical protein